MKCLICVDHDIIYRNFILSGSFEALARVASLVFIFPDSPRVTVDLSNFAHRWVKLPVDTERAALWRRLFQITQMRWRPGTNWRAIRATLRYTLGLKGSLQIGFLAFPGIFGIYRRHLLKRLNARSNAALESIVTSEQPDFILMPTVLEGPFLNDLIEIGRRLQIPTIAVMNSWDNPSTKRSVTGMPDRLLVWGPQTFNHAIRYVGIPQNQALCFGAAQFDVFRLPTRYGRAELCARYGIDPQRRIVLYAGSTKHTDEFGHLLLLDGAISSGKLQNVAIIYRPHPWGNCGSNGGRFSRHHWENVFIDSTMADYVETVGKGTAKMKLADYQDTHDLLSAVDALVSPMSTILLEAAMHGKPILCFQSGVSGNTAMRVRVNQAQFSELFHSPEVLVCGDDNFLPVIQSLVDRAVEPGIASRMRRMCDEFVTPFDAPFSERLPKLLSDLQKEMSETNGIGR
jgi:hypothetical protein